MVLRQRTGEGLASQNGILIPSAFPVTVTAEAVTRPAQGSTSCYRLPSTARAGMLEGTGEEQPVHGTWDTAGPVPAPAGSPSTHTGAQLCRPPASGAAESHLLAWRMLMAAACFTQQLPLSSYSRFSIRRGKENEFSPHI